MATTATNQTTVDATATSTVTVALADLPSFIADQASALTPAASPDAGSTAPSANPTPKAAQAVKELQISLDPEDLGAMTLKLRLAGGKLSVTIGVANPQTLAAIKDDSALIAQRLASNNQALDDLVIQQQNIAPTSTETTHASANASDSTAEDEASPNESRAGRRQGGSSGRASGGGGFSPLVV